MQPWARIVLKQQEREQSGFDLKLSRYEGNLNAPLAVRLAVLAVLLAGCGADMPATTLSVTYSGSVALVGTRSIDVLGDQVNGRTTLTFADPANSEKTGSLSVPPRDRCTITPVISSSG